MTEECPSSNDIQTAVTVRHADWEADERLIRAVREAVFVVEQNVPVELDFDGSDVDCRHVLAFEGDKPVGTARIGTEGDSGRIGRMAVLATHRRSGVGSLLMDLLLDLARELGHTRLHLHSQVSAKAFYESFGFVAEGDEFTEAGIPHITMTTRIPTAS